MALWSKNLVTVMSFSARSLLTALSSSKKFARAVSRNLVTETSLASKNLPVDVPKNSMMLYSRYLLGSTLLSYPNEFMSKSASCKNLVTLMSSGFCARNLETGTSLSSRNLVTVVSRNFVTVTSLD